MDYTHTFYQLRVLVKCTGVWWIFLLLQNHLPLKNMLKYPKFFENSKWHPALMKNIRFVHTLSCGHLGPEGCCVPSLKCVQWLPLT